MRSASPAKPSAIDRILAFDLETTGLDPDEHRIVEFAFILLDARDPALPELDRWHELVDPGMSIPEQATDVHGISDEDVAGAPGFGYLAPVVQSMVDAATVLMAYNHTFDKDFLHAELVRAGGHGIADDHPFIDPLELFANHAPHTDNKLTTAVSHYLEDGLDGAHRAIHDTAAMVDVFRRQRELDKRVREDLAEALVEPREWLDRKRKVYRDVEGVVRFGFGKHEGEPVTAHASYARWMLGADFEDDTKQVLRELVGEG